MSVFTGKKLRVYDGTPVGQVVQSPINLEAITNGQWVMLDGRDCNRGQYPEIAPYFPAGVFTSTARTLGAIPAVATVVSDGTNFVASAAAGTTACQRSADGITWNTVTGFAASEAARALVNTGVRTIVCGDGATQMNGGGYAIANGATSATALTTGASTTLVQGLAYSPSLGLTVMIPNGASSNFYTLADGATAWTTRTGTSRTKTAIVWTGKMFIAATATQYLLQTSTDGTTWNDVYIQFGTAPSNGFNLCSDGNGTVVISAGGTGSSGYLVVSKDGGTTWRAAPMPVESCIGVTGEAYYTMFAPSSMSYVNGRFIAFGYSGFIHSFFSVDGINWQREDVMLRGANAQVSSGTPKVAYKAGTYCLIQDSTAAATATEDMSRFRLPKEVFTLANTASNFVQAFGHAYMKVRS